MIGPDGHLSSGRVGRLSKAPWWLLALALAATVFAWRATTSTVYAEIFSQILSGLGVTLAVTAVAFPLAIGLGLVTALGLVSVHPIRRNLATLYVQVARGVPILVQIFLVAFVLVPLGVDALHWIVGGSGALGDLRASDVPMGARVVAALVCAYGAFEAETIRGGPVSYTHLRNAVRPAGVVDPRHHGPIPPRGKAVPESGIVDGKPQVKLGRNGHNPLSHPKKERLALYIV